MLNQTEPYKTVLGTVKQTYKKHMQIVFKPWQTLLCRLYSCYTRTYSCYIRVKLVPTNPLARLEPNTRTSQPGYNPVYRMVTVYSFVFCVSYALQTPAGAPTICDHARKIIINNRRGVGRFSNFTVICEKLK